MIYTDNLFVLYSKALQERYDIEKITNMWNAAKLGKHAKVSTIKRWLRPGPDTKNPRFVPWVVQAATDAIMERDDPFFTSNAKAAKMIPVELIATWINRWYVAHDKDRLSLATVKQYLNGHAGSKGYENGPPDDFKRALKWVMKYTQQ